MKMIIPDLFRSIEQPWSLSIRGHCQTDNYRCGLSAAWTVVKFFQPDASFSDFCELCTPVPKWGLSTDKMAKCLREQGLHVSVKRVLDLDRIETCIRNRQLILVCMGGKYSDDHWVVIHGVNRKGRILYSGRTLPWFTRTSMSWKKFSKRCDSVMLIVYP